MAAAGWGYSLGYAIAFGGAEASRIDIVQFRMEVAL